MDRVTGRPLAGDDHLAQSIGDILSTPIGTRVGRRDYGSLLASLLDQPFNPATRVRLFAAIAGALLRWEPRIALTRVDLSRRSDGIVLVAVEGRRTDAPRPNALTRLTLPLPGVA
ncbi:GPW/gp25 family protein [Sphingomonas sp.]|uniref:GPW/gp25 family protein n=1 Tax=Sphingomonas sp. TaxID=28214 RepID=UPI003B3B3E27